MAISSASPLPSRSLAVLSSEPLRAWLIESVATIPPTPKASAINVKSQRVALEAKLLKLRDKYLGIMFLPTGRIHLSNRQIGYPGSIAHDVDALGEGSACGGVRDQNDGAAPLVDGTP